MVKLKALCLFYWRRLNGSRSEFQLPDRIFHAVCLISIAALGYNIPLSYLVGLPMIAAACAVTLFLFAGVYYLSRFKRRTSQARLIFCLVGNVLFVGNFFMNSGIDGPTNIFFILTIIMIAAIVPVRQFGYWVTANLILVFGINYSHYLRPDWAPYNYRSIQERYFDIFSAYVTVVAITIFSFYILRRSYETERNSANQRAKVLRLLNDEKNKLFSIIAHDLRSPLANIQNYLELLGNEDITAAEAKGITQSLLAATRSTLEMLNNVLLWTKSQMNGLSPKFGSINLYQRLSSQLKLFMDIAANKGITLEISIDSKLEIWGNGDMLQLIVRNLVNNAVKFTTSGGKVSVSATQNGNTCLLKVSDTGNGQPVVLTQEIFYLSGATEAGTAGEKGVGLGLVLCKEYAEAQNATLWFECDSHSGATFYLELPLFRLAVGQIQGQAVQAN